MSNKESPTVLCLASRFEGCAFLEAVARQGAETMLLTVESLRDARWPREAIGDFFTMPDGLLPYEVLKMVYKIARHARIDRVVSIGETDLGLAAMLREELRLPGMGQTTARILSDVLAMRARARQGGVRVPESVRVVYYDELRRWMDTMSGPWVLRPRQSARIEANDLPVRKVDTPKELWRALEETGERQSEYLLEQYIAGESFHVESLMWQKQMVFQSVHSYSDRDGIVTVQTVESISREGRELRALDKHLLPGLGMVAGSMHSEYVRSDDDNELYLMKSSARVAGAPSTQVVDCANAVNLWEEWARMELAMLRGQGYSLPKIRQVAAGALMCRTKQQVPDLGAYTGEEIALRLAGAHQAGLVVHARSGGRVGKLLEGLRQEFQRDFTV